MFKRIVSKINRIRAQRNLLRARDFESKNEERLVVENFPLEAKSSLSESETLQFDSTWSWTGLKPSHKEIEIFKHYRGFDARYLTHYQYLPIVAHALNNYRWTKTFEHKSLTGFIPYAGALQVPRCFVRSISGELYGETMDQLSAEEAVRRCAAETGIVVKDADGTSGGKSVEILSTLTTEDLKRRSGRDFVVQELVSQHSSIAAFNPSSLNTFRVTTLYLNGKFSVLSIIFRMGKQGMKVDNWGAGGIIVGVEPDGRLHDTGYDIKMNEFTGVNGIKFAESSIDFMPKILKAIEEDHIHRYSLCKFIGWDIAVNESADPVLIEVNSSKPGVIGEQLCTGPIFGERTEEVIDYCKR